MNIESDDMCVGVQNVIAALVVDSGNIPSDAFGDRLAELLNKCFSLRWHRFNGKRNNEALAGSTFTRGGLLFSQLCGLGVSHSLQPPSQNAARSRRSGDVTQMRGRLSVLGSARANRALFGKSANRVSERE